MHSTEPLVSILCTCYNHEKFVVTALNSVLNQSYKNIELFIIDDFSTDNSIEIIEEWYRNNQFGTIIKNKENLGITKSFNSAFRETKGAYLIDLSADDALLPDYVETLISVFNAYKNYPVGIVYGNALVTDYTSKESYSYFEALAQKKKTTTPNDGFVYEELIDHSNPICSVSAMMDRHIFEKLGKYDDCLVYEDYDFWLRVARNHHILYIDKILVKKFIIKNSLGSSVLLGVDKKNYGFMHSTYCIVKKTLQLNQTKKENEASIRKILLEIKANVKILNFSLCLKYLWLLIKFKLNH